MIDIKKKLNEKDVKIIDYMDKNLMYIFDEDTELYFFCIDTMEDYYSYNKLEMPKYVYAAYLDEIGIYYTDYKTIVKLFIEE